VFLFKNLVGDALMPYALGVVLLVLGVALLWLQRRPQFARFLLTAATLLLIGAGCDPVAKRLIGSLENDFDPLLDTTQLQGIGWVVVLGGGHRIDPTLPYSTRLTDAARARLVEGIRIHRELPGSRMLFSGYSVPVSHARVMAEAAMALGVDSAQIALEEISMDTEDEARLITELLAGQRFVLVTSAVHLPRAAQLFRSVGADFVAAPADYDSRPRRSNFRAWIFPRWTALGSTERTWHEYLGMTWAALGGG
jgi:uncharacterized SAM-binding protein YcdF (DUF218 family)